MSGALADSWRRLPPAPVDSGPRGRQIAGVNRKPTKVEETATSYAAKQPAKPEALAQSPEPCARQTGDEAFKAVSDKIFSERKELLRKLAQ